MHFSFNEKSIQLDYHSLYGRTDTRSQQNQNALNRIKTSIESHFLSNKDLWEGFIEFTNDQVTILSILLSDCFRY